MWRQVPTVRSETVCPSEVHFFVTAGSGVIRVVFDMDALESALGPFQAALGQFKNEVRFSFNASAGVRFRLSDSHGVRRDVRGYMSPALRHGLPASSADPNATVFPVEHAFHHLNGAFSFVVHV